MEHVFADTGTPASPLPYLPAAYLRQLEYDNSGLPEHYSGFRDDAKWLREKLAPLPAKLRKFAATRYSNTYLHDGEIKANTWLRETSEWIAALPGNTLKNYDLSDSEICELAAEQAMRVRHQLARLKRGDPVGHDDDGICPAELASLTPVEQNARTFPAYWRKAYRREYRQGREMIAYKLGAVHEHRQKYCSDQGVEERRQQRHRWSAWSKNVQLTNGDKSVPLHDVLKASAKHRRAEMLVLSLGLQQVAEADGLKWSMWTLTAPPSYHPNPSNGHNTWDGSTPRQAHDYIALEWKRVRARLADIGITLAGFRVTEPQADGTTHWHMGVYYRPEDRPAIIRAIRMSWPLDRDKKTGAVLEKQIGAREEVGDMKKGDFTGYMMKYLEKNLFSDARKDGEAERCDAWRATWLIRGHQFFGIPNISLWRELRRQDYAPSAKGNLAASLWRAARDERAKDFINLMGGLFGKRPAKLINAVSKSGQKLELPAPAEGTRQFYVLDKTRDKLYPLKTRAIWSLTVIQSSPSKATSEPQNDAGYTEKVDNIASQMPIAFNEWMQRLENMVEEGLTRSHIRDALSPTLYRMATEPACRRVWGEIDALLVML